MKLPILQAYLVEPAVSGTSTSGIATVNVILLRLRAQGIQHDYVLSAIDARQIAAELLKQAAVIAPPLKT